MKVTNKKNKNGFTLLETLVALVVLAIGMLGIGNLLLLSHKSNASNYTRQQAIQSAYDILDRISANRLAAISGNYAVNNIVSTGTPTAPSTPSANCGTSSCSATQLATYDTWYWLATDVAQIPNGCGSISTSTSGLNTIVTVTVQWNDSQTQQLLGTANPTPSQFIIKSEL